ncbi:MAG: YoaK family protein [Candidatus Cybelea sp.]
MRVAPFYGLSFTAGCVDAIAFLRLGNVFTANMTGNTVLLGIAIASRLGSLSNSLGIGPPLLAIAAFVIGAGVTLPVFRAGFDARRAGLLVLAEAVLVAFAGTAFAIFNGQWVVALCIALVSFAMGAQSIIASKAGIPGISTTYVTGTLVTAVTRLFARGPRDERRRDAERDALAWLAYLCGAAVGTVSLMLFHRAALLPPVILFVALAAWFFRFPSAGITPARETRRASHERVE